MTAGLSKADFSSILREIFADSKVNKVILFGSRAKGTFSAGSDIDLALLGDKLGLENLLDIYSRLDELFLPYKIDLVIYNNITEDALREHIDLVGVMFTRGANDLQ